LDALLVMPSSPRSKLTSTSARTREQLILAGERLFATQGIDNVSLRQINTEAGQRNSSAAHYHFGSKEALLLAIYEYRMEQIDLGWREWLDRALAGERTPTVRTLVETLIYPLVEHIDTTEGGHNYIRFLAQVFGHPALDLRTMMKGQFSRTVAEVYRLLHTALPDIPDEVFGPRVGLMWELVINALADRTKLMQAAADSGRLQLTLPALFVCNLADSAEALISAAPSAATLRELEAVREGFRQRA
jgi:AcrR family transcriptional regulator